MKSTFAVMIDALEVRRLLSLPAPWIETDLGSPGVPGSSSFDPATQTFSISTTTSSGQDSADHFIYQTLMGDGSIIARFSCSPFSNVRSSAGLLITQDANGFGNLSLEIGRAPAGDGGSGELSASFVGVFPWPPIPTLPTPNGWLRLTRIGTNVTGWVSSDGSAWTPVSHDVLIGTGPVKIGLFDSIWGSDQSGTDTATFDHVAVASFSTSQVPNIPITAPAQVVEGSDYSLTIGQPTDGPAIREYLIDWGDGSDEQNLTAAGTIHHVFSTAQIDTIHVEVTDNAVTYEELPMPVQVQDAPLSLTASPIHGSVGGTYLPHLAQLVDSDPNAPSLDPSETYSVSIDWGDGSPLDSAGIGRDGTNLWVLGNHEFTKSGTFNVHITVTDIGGASATITTLAHIQRNPASAELDGPTASDTQTPVTFQITGYDDPGLTIRAFQVFFGDDSPPVIILATRDPQSDPTEPSFLATVQHLYAKPGLFTARPQAIDQDGEWLTSDYDATDILITNPLNITPVTIHSTSTTVTVPGGEYLAHRWFNEIQPSDALEPDWTDNGDGTSTLAFYKAGQYTFGAGDYGQIAFDSLTVNVEPSATSITVTPSHANISTGGTYHLEANTLDQFGDYMPDQPAVFQWKILSGNATVNHAGLLTSTGPSGGTITLVASADGLTSKSITFNIAAAPRPTSFPASPKNLYPYLLDNFDDGYDAGLIWNDGDSSADGFLIEGSTDGGKTFNPLTIAPANATSAYLTNLVYDDTYQFRITPFNAVGKGIPAVSKPLQLGDNSIAIGWYKVSLPDTQPLFTNTGPDAVTDSLQVVNSGWIYAYSPADAIRQAVTGSFTDLTTGVTYNFPDSGAFKYDNRDGTLNFDAHFSTDGANRTWADASINVTADIDELDVFAGPEASATGGTVQPASGIDVGQFEVPPGLPVANQDYQATITWSNGQTLIGTLSSQNGEMYDVTIPAYPHGVVDSGSYTLTVVHLVNGNTQSENIGSYIDPPQIPLSQQLIPAPPIPAPQAPAPIRDFQTNPPSASSPVTLPELAAPKSPSPADPQIQVSGPAPTPAIDQPLPIVSDAVGTAQPSKLQKAQPPTPPLQSPFPPN